RLGNSFLKVKSDIYRNCPKGFYVFAKPNNCNPNDVFKYIGRYLGRPVIATSRIDSYDGERVTFHYHRHEDDKLVTECIPATEFISRLIRHIPEKHFKMIRYYGIYTRHYDNENPIHRAIPKEKHQILLSFNKWRESILSSFGYDPLKCPKCGKIMFFVELYFNHKSVSLQELYERIMKKSRVPT
ncbi:transposase, partial [Aequitasia blattaphilus]